MPVGTDELECDLVRGTLHLQHGGIVRLVIDAPTGRQHRRERPLSHEIGGAVAGPGQQCLIDPDQEPVRRRRQVTARREFVQFGVDVVNH